jgi:demethylmenaquinone methyltransferase / 2-methoxy-6-polyprenyl-1,4-benzoquinol methylase
MSHLTGEERADYVRKMFGRIAQRYDRLNKLMTFGQDARWRRETVKHLSLSKDARVLDLGTGTGDLSYEILHQNPGSLIVAADFTPEMMMVGKQRSLSSRKIEWVVADALHLPFSSDAFDGVTSGFLLRNVTDLPLALDEQYRVLHQNGHFTCLDTTPPQPGPLRPLLEFHLHRIIPLLGRWIAGDPDAYTYLPDSTEKFVTAEELADALRTAGFKSVNFLRRMLGTVGIHWGQKD